MKKIYLTLTISVFCLAAVAQKAPKPYGSLPSNRQLRWQETEMYCIVHFSMATFTDKEWGYGDEDPMVFNPKHFNASQIVNAAKSGGFKGIVVVAKHHDGFCLWPTKTTPHNISHSPWKKGKGDLVKEYQIACQNAGIKMGIYCSPWDRSNAAYGKPEYVTEVYRKQLKELYSHYGHLFMSWHDGANGGDGFYGGSRGVRTIDRSNYYDWEGTWAITRKMQPGAAIFGDIGPDIRWIGNEDGHAGETSWATYSPLAPDPGKKPANGYSLYEKATEGTRNGLHWIPAECDVPMRRGWFYHQSQDGQSKSAYELLNLYYQSVGRGACLDLGLSPDKNGLLTNEDIGNLKQFGAILKKTFSVNLAKDAEFKASNVRGNNRAKYGPAYLVDASRYSYWATDDDVTRPVLRIKMPGRRSFNVIRLRENIKLGQRIDSIAVDAWLSGGWKQIASATSIGANRLIRLPQNILTDEVRLRVTGSPVCIALSDFGLFKEPSHLSAPEIDRESEGLVNIHTVAPVSAIYYTLDGTNPDIKSPLFVYPFALPGGGLVKAAAFDEQKFSPTAARVFGLDKSGWHIINDSSDFIQNAGHAIDDNKNTLWSTLQRDTEQYFNPAHLDIDLGETMSIGALTYLPRQDKKTAGMINKYVIYSSANGHSWTELSRGEFSNIKANPVEQVVSFSKPVQTRFIRFEGTAVISGNGVTAAEIGLNKN